MAVLFDTADANATAILYALTQRLKVKVTRTTVREQLLSHPAYPSLLSLSEVLTDWQVDNAAIQLNTVEQLRELPLPFVAHLHQDGGRYVLVTDQQGDEITYLDHTDSQVRRSKTLADFERSWSGVVLLAEAVAQSGEANYPINHWREQLEALRTPFVLFSALLLFGLFTLKASVGFAPINWILLVTKTIGLSVSGLLVAKQLGYKNTLTDRLCSADSKTNCENVLNSAAAKLWGWLSWSDVGLLYFAGGLLTIWMSATAPVWPLVYALALLALPYTVFSVYYQARVVRQWCPLCLVVQGVLLTEGVAAFALIQPLPGSIPPYLLALSAFLLPTLAWVILKFLLGNAAQSKREHDELLRLKRDPALFQAVLRQQTKMPTIPTDLKPIVLGNPAAEHTVTVVTNPYCPPCAKIHGELETLLRQNANVKVHVIFYTCDGPAGQRATVAKHLMATPDKEQALNGWYAAEKKDYTDWRRRYPVMNNDSYYADLVQRHCDWCNQADIEGTPTLFIDGYQRPNHYSLLQISKLVNYSNNGEVVEPIS